VKSSTLDGVLNQSALNFINRIFFFVAKIKLLRLLVAVRAVFAVLEV
jgi:hypothetical protein